MHHRALQALAVLACLAGVAAFAPSPLFLQQHGALKGLTSQQSCLRTVDRRLGHGRGSLSLRAILDPGEEGFEDINLRLKKLEREAKEYKGTDQEDLAEGLKDDINQTREKLNQARKASKSRLLKSIAMGAAAAAAIGAAVFALGPRKAYAATLPRSAEPTTQVQNEASRPSFIAADSWGGAKAGYVFKTGPRGSGYYLDSGSLASIQTSDGRNVLMQLADNKATVGVAAFAAGLAASSAIKRFPRKGDSQAKPPSPFSASSGAPAAPASASTAAPKKPPPKADPFVAKPAEAVSGRDPASMRASELKKAIVEMGGNTGGIVEKDELVALYKRLKAAPKEVPTSKYNPSAPEGSIANDFANFDPNSVDPAAVDEMMQNPMMRTLSNQMMNDPEAMRELQDAMSGGKGMGEVMKSAKFQEMAQNMMRDPEVSKMMQNPKEIQKMIDQMKKMGVKPPGM